MESTTDPAQLVPELGRLRARVRADQRATSAPLVVFGVLILLYPVLDGPLTGQLAAGGRHLALLAYWPITTAVGLGALWLAARRRARRDGVGEGRRTYRHATRRYLIALLLVVLLFLPVLFVGVFAPLVWPAAVLAALGWWQHDAQLGRWAAVTGVLGGTAAILAVATAGSGWLWLAWLGDGLLGMAMIGGAALARRRELAAG
ncbi:hypothetical protein [Actinocatenispora sera]|uniref:Uncharacterized protein n=1 Tax=Actinocatenispora sera TaxID=390989 RepID=A0A810L6L7_9ACTN|nr:hypothetical protein [Actinocatenispora sera]BCJ29951.1 hypothetical protein Asera_40590 [Actinocatenispora sera]